jgi:hypothetical protein
LNTPRNKENRYPFHLLPQTVDELSRPSNGLNDQIGLPELRGGYSTHSILLSSEAEGLTSCLFWNSQQVSLISFASIIMYASSLNEPCGVFSFPFYLQAGLSFAENVRFKGLTIEKHEGCGSMPAKGLGSALLL